MQQLLSPIEQLFQEDKAVIFNDDFYRRPDEFFDLLYEKILLLVSYDNWDARNVLQTGVWYYCYCINTSIYHYEYDPNLGFLESDTNDDRNAYLELLRQYIKSNENHIGIFGDLVREVASILHWKLMKISAENEHLTYKDCEDGKEKIIWFYVQPQDWDIHFITPDFKFSSQYLLLTVQNIQALENAKTRWSMVSDIEALLLRNYATTCLLKAFIPRDDLRSLVYESIESFLIQQKQDNISEKIIIAIKVAKYLLNTTSESRVNMELQEALLEREMHLQDEMPQPGQFDVMMLFTFRAAWMKQRHLCNPSRDIYNFIFATICCVCPKYNPLYEYYKGKISSSEGVNYLSKVSLLPDIIINVDNSIVQKYVNKYYYPEFLLTSKNINDESYPRSIETIVGDLNISEVHIADFTLPSDTMKREYLGRNVLGIGELDGVVVNALSKDISLFIDFVNQIANQQFIENNDESKLLLSQIILGRNLGAPLTKKITWYNDEGQFLGYLVAELYKKGRRKDFSGIYMKARENKKPFNASIASTYNINCDCPERSIVNNFMAKCKALKEA